MCPHGVLGSTVAHHHGVGARRSDRLTLCPLLTASLSLESYPLADQFALTGATGADGTNGEPCCQELCLGGGGEVHRVLCGVVGVGVAPSVTVADIPLGGGGGGRQATLDDRLTTCRLSVHLGGVLCHDGGHVEFGLGHWSFRFDVISLQAGDAP